MECTKSHWILIVVFMKEKTIQVFCSLNWCHKMPARVVFQYLQDDHEDKHKEGQKLPDLDQWIFHYLTPHASLQGNDYDCGVFVCMTADFLSNGWSLIYTQAHIKHCCV